MRTLFVLLPCLLSFGCSAALAKGDGRAFGDDLGRFHVTAHMDSSTCGPQAMDAPDKWEFDVVLSKKAPSIYWNTGADAIEGTLANDGKTFAFTSESVVNVAASANTASPAADPGGLSGLDPATPSQRGGCTVVRDDDSAGALDDADAATAFDGTLEYRFAPQGSSDCSDLLTQGGFATLPCSMKYDMAAAWVSAR